jgi:hypothetical protein
MHIERLPLGVFTTDERLVVRTWDGWMAAATGVEPARALNRPVSEVIPASAQPGWPSWKTSSPTGPWR